MTLGRAIGVPRRPAQMKRYESLWKDAREALWHGQADKAIETIRTLIASLQDAVQTCELQPFFASCAQTAKGAATRLLDFVKNNRRNLINYNSEHHNGRRISTASAESVMNHMINRRLSKLQQMRWSMAGAHDPH